MMITVENITRECGHNIIVYAMWYTVVYSCNTSGDASG